MASADDPDSWIDFVRRRVHALVIKRHREEVESEILGLLTRYFMQGRRIRSLAEFVNAVIPRLVSRCQRREAKLAVLPIEDLDHLVAGKAPQANGADKPTVHKVRGKFRQKLLADIRSGKTCAEIAAETGKPENEVRRQVCRLAEHLFAAAKAARDAEAG